MSNRKGTEVLDRRAALTKRTPCEELSNLRTHVQAVDALAQVIPSKFQVCLDNTPGALSWSYLYGCITDFGVFHEGLPIV